jgi:hypothetical protein
MKNYERYKDLEHLLFKGFIPYKLKVGNLNLVFKSINELELEKINLMSGLEKDPKYVYNIHINYLFYSIFMIEGTNILAYRDKYYSDIYNIFNNLPFNLIKKIFNKLEDLAKRTNNCTPLVESYSYETVSRYTWRYKKGTPINGSIHTGITGTDTLGLNEFQKYWVALNLKEDRQNTFDEQYSLAKFLASFTNSKAVKQIEDKERISKEEEDNRRERIRVVGTEEEIKYLSGPTDTREGIVEELNKQMRGEKDDHDRFIEEYEKNLKMNMFKQMKQMKKMKDERVKHQDRFIEEARAITPEEMAERIKKMQERKDRNPVVRSYDNDKEQYSKYFDMSNVKDRDIIRESDFLNEEEYNELVEDDIFGGIHRPVDSEEKQEAEDEYIKQQKTLASKFDNPDNLDFPNLRNK